MTLEISARRLLRPSLFALLVALFLTIPSVSFRALAQQPDNDDMNRPSAEKPDKDRDRDKDRVKDKDKDRDRDRDRDRDEHKRRNEAQSEQATRRPDNDITHHELESFDSFLDSNPEVGRELARNPSLVNDRNFVDKHPNLARYLQNHPGVREEIRENPQGFMQREKRFENSGEDITNTELRNFDNFLDSHPQISKDLQKNPGLMDDQNYSNSHPELKEFLSTHAGVREQVREHPGIFMKREQKYEKNESPQR
ncbi:MAG TPA: hemophore-related protein [Terriglobales bacterium]|nr:hemophore-related protein [Terriglobales bacterium]